MDGLTPPPPPTLAHDGVELAGEGTCLSVALLTLATDSDAPLERQGFFGGEGLPSSFEKHELGSLE